MEKTVSSQEASGRFGDLLQGVSAKGDRYVVELVQIALRRLRRDVPGRVEQ